MRTSLLTTLLSALLSFCLIACKEETPPTPAKPAKKEIVKPEKPVPTEKEKKYFERWTTRNVKDGGVWRVAVKLCPKGSKLPTNKDWKILEPILQKYPELEDDFTHEGNGWWWSSTEIGKEAWVWRWTGKQFKGEEREKATHFFVRCITNN